jgi:protein gp37
MANSSSIEWTEATWNPLTGCTKVSPGCKHCYAERMAKRLQAMDHPSYANGFKLSLHEDLLGLPLQWKRPRTIFVNSMSDLFHQDVPVEFIERVFHTMCDASHHRFQVLTKRPERALELSSLLPWPDNVWLGTSVETNKYARRIDVLRQTGACVKFLSLEPLLGPLGGLNLEDIHWVIVGGESGPGARPMDPTWVAEIRDQCLAREVPFFFKQWGGVNKKRTGRLLEGRTWDDMPAVAGWQDTPNQARSQQASRQLALI